MFIGQTLYRQPSSQFLVLFLETGCHVAQAGLGFTAAGHAFLMPLTLPPKLSDCRRAPHAWLPAGNESISVQDEALNETVRPLPPWSPMS